MWLIFVSLAIAVTGIGLAWLMYYKKSIPEDALSSKFPGVHKLLLNKYYMDELYLKAFVQPTVAIGKFFWEMDRNIIDGIVNFVGRATRSSGRTFAKRHDGQLQTYGLVTIIGGLAVIAVAFVLGGYFG